MDKSFLLVMVAAMAGVALATIWLVKRFIQPPTAAGSMDRFTSGSCHP